METTIKNVKDLQITGRQAYKMTENSKTSLKHITKQLPPELLLENRCSSVVPLCFAKHPEKGILSSYSFILKMYSCPCRDHK